MATTTLTKNPQAAGGAAPAPQQGQPHRAPATEAAEQSRERLKRRLSYSFDNHMLERGMHHPAEKIIDEALSEHKELAYQWLAEICMDEKDSFLAASVLYCLGGKPGLGTPEWRLAIVRSGLKSDDIELRDVAAEASEAWMDDDIAEVLKAHVLTETQTWLRQYIQDLIDGFQAK